MKQITLVAIGTILSMALLLFIASKLDTVVNQSKGKYELIRCGTFSGCSVEGRFTSLEVCQDVAKSMTGPVVAFTCDPNNLPKVPKCEDK